MRRLLESFSEEGCGFRQSGGGGDVSRISAGCVTKVTGLTKD